MKRLLILSTLLMLMASSAFSQPQDEEVAPDQVVIEKVQVSLSGVVFFITYRISLGEYVKSCNVALLLSDNGGGSFFLKDLEHSGVSGDVGLIKSSGEKKILYLMSKEEVLEYSDKPLVFKVAVANKKLFNKAKLRKKADKELDKLLNTQINGQVPISAFIPTVF